MESWQVFHYAQKVLPPETLRLIYTRTTRQVYYWAANPAHSKSTRNPIDRLARVLGELDKAGYEHVAQAAIDLLAAPLGGCFAFLESEPCDKCSLDGELTDTLEALGEFAKECRKAAEDGKLDAEERGRVLKSMRSLQSEINQVIEVMGV
jgi:hypothetical protein